MNVWIVNHRIFSTQSIKHVKNVHQSWKDAHTVSTHQNVLLVPMGTSEIQSLIFVDPAHNKKDACYARTKQTVNIVVLRITLTEPCSNAGNAQRLWSSV